MTEPDDIISLALECGFMLLTTHGQGTDKLMPVSDIDTLVKFYRQAEQRGREERAKLTEGLLRELRDLKRGIDKEGYYRKGLLRGKELFKDVYGFPYSEFDGSWEEWYAELVKRLETAWKTIQQEANKC